MQRNPAPVTTPVTLHAVHIPTDREITAAFATRVHHRRDELGLSLRALALRSGVSHTMAWAVEGRDRHVSLVNAVKLSIALESPLTSLLEPVPCHVCLGHPQPGMTCNSCHRTTALT
jgi:hypothetical protein